jgi:hypothetical protein
MNINGTQLQYIKKGYEYRTYEDVEDDNIKIFHHCFKDGKEIEMSYHFYNESPYELIAPELFGIYINQLEVFIQG